MKTCTQIFFLLFLGLTACTTPPGNDAPYASKNHSANVVITHKVEAEADVESCKLCHGEDYFGGTVNKSCMECHHNSCANCHDADELAQGGTISSHCVGCHGGAPAPFTHHDTSSALAGNCTWCHADPRPALDSTNTYIAAQNVAMLSCSDCHATKYTNDGTIYKLSYTPTVYTGVIDAPAVCTNLPTPIPAGENLDKHWGDGIARVIETAMDGTGGTIDHSFSSGVTNYGACLGCHLTGYGSATSKVSVFHARPIDWAASGNDTVQNGSVSLNDDHSAVLLWAPGRNYFNLFGPNSPYGMTLQLGDLWSRAVDAKFTLGDDKFYLCSGLSLFPYGGPYACDTCEDTRGFYLYDDTVWCYRDSPNGCGWDTNEVGYSTMTIPVGAWNNSEGIVSGPDISVPHF